MTDPRVRYLFPLAAWLAVVVLISILEGTPRQLPAVALDSTVLLHALRAGALFATGLAVATVLARAATGRLPTMLSTSGIGYDAEESRVTTTTLDTLQAQLTDQEVVLDGLVERLDKLPHTS
jgi:hypothetical protein